MGENGKPMYTIYTTATLVDVGGGMTEVREATITVNMDEIQPHTSIDLLEEVRHLNRAGYTVTVVVRD